MKPEAGLCPVKHLIQPSEKSRCPVHRIFSWFKTRIFFITDKIPFRQQNVSREAFESASCAFSEILLEHHFHIDYVLRYALCASVNEGGYTSPEVAIEKLFLQYSDSSNGTVSDTLIDAMSAIEQKYQTKFQSATHDSVMYGRIINAYPFGVKVIHDTWRNLIIAFKVRYGRFPTPEETKSFRKFIIDFTTMIGKTPALFAVSMRELLIKANPKPTLVISQDGQVDFHPSKEKAAIQLTELELGQSGKFGIHQKMLNGFCPALPLIPKIAGMCCDLLEGAYADICKLTE